MSTTSTETVPIDESRIDAVLSSAPARRGEDAAGVHEVLAKAKELKGLELREMAVLMAISDPELLGDHRALDEVIRDVARLGYIPSFCTACYRLGRTGQDFMDMAKPGEIKNHCDPNALSTFLEYLIDYASPKTREVGERLIGDTLKRMDGLQRGRSDAMLKQVREGKRDVYC